MSTAHDDKDLDKALDLILEDDKYDDLSHPAYHEKTEPVKLVVSNKQRIILGVILGMMALGMAAQMFIHH